MSISEEEVTPVIARIRKIFDKLVDESLDWCVITPQGICYWVESESEPILKAKESIDLMFAALRTRLKLMADLSIIPGIKQNGYFEYKDNLFIIDIIPNAELGYETITIKVWENNVDI